MSCRIGVGILCLLLTAPSMAQNNDWQDTCDEVSKLAKTLMTARQNGVSMAKVMSKTEDNELIQQMVIDAYDNPRFHTEEIQRRTISDFRDQWYSNCVKSLRSSE